MEFLTIELSQYIGVPFFEKLKNNFDFLKEKISSKYDVPSGYNLDVFEKPNYNMNITTIKDLFTKVEENIFVFDLMSDWINEYSDGDKPTWKIWDHKQSNKYVLVKRWLDWMNYSYLIVSGQEEKRQYLNDEVEQVFDNSGQPIITLEGYF